MYTNKNSETRFFQLIYVIFLSRSNINVAYILVFTAGTLNSNCNKQTSISFGFNWKQFICRSFESTFAVYPCLGDRPTFSRLFHFLLQPAPALMTHRIHRLVRCAHRCPPANGQFILISCVDYFLLLINIYYTIVLCYQLIVDCVCYSLTYRNAKTTNSIKKKAKCFTHLGQIDFPTSFLNNCFDAGC